MLAIVKLMFIRGINVCNAGFIWWYGRVEGLDANKQYADERDCAKVLLPSLGMCWDGAAAFMTLSSVHLGLLPCLPIPTTQISYSGLRQYPLLFEGINFHISTCWFAGPVWRRRLLYTVWHSGHSDPLPAFPSAVPKNHMIPLMNTWVPKQFHLCLLMFVKP